MTCRKNEIVRGLSNRKIKKYKKNQLNPFDLIDFVS